MDILGGGGKSTINYLISNVEGKRVIEDMKVGNNDDSDYQPIEIRMKLMAEKIEKDNGSRTNWHSSKTGIKKYIE